MAYTTTRTKEGKVVMTFYNPQTKEETSQNVYTPGSKTYTQETFGGTTNVGLLGASSSTPSQPSSMDKAKSTVSEVLPTTNPTNILPKGQYTKQENLYAPIDQPPYKPGMAPTTYVKNGDNFVYTDSKVNTNVVKNVNSGMASVSGKPYYQKSESTNEGVKTTTETVSNRGGLMSAETKSIDETGNYRKSFVSDKIVKKSALQNASEDVGKKIIKSDTYKAGQDVLFGTTRFYVRNEKAQNFLIEGEKGFTDKIFSNPARSGLVAGAGVVAGGFTLGAKTGYAILGVYSAGVGYGVLKAENKGKYLGEEVADFGLFMGGAKLGSTLKPLPYRVIGISKDIKGYSVEGGLQKLPSYENIKVPTAQGEKVVYRGLVNSQGKTILGYTSKKVKADFELPMATKEPYVPSSNSRATKKMIEGLSVNKYSNFDASISKDVVGLSTPSYAVSQKKVKIKNFPTETKSLGIENQAKVYAMNKRSGSLGYGSTTIEAQLPQGEFAKARGSIKEPASGDFDLQSTLFKRGSAKQSNNLLKQLKASGTEKVSKPSVNENLIVSQGNIKYPSLSGQRNAVDIHGRVSGGTVEDVPTEFLGNQFYKGYVKTKQVGKVMTLEESRLRKLAGSIGYTQEGYAPQTKRVKDVSDYIVIQENADKLMGRKSNPSLERYKAYMQKKGFYNPNEPSMIKTGTDYSLPKSSPSIKISPSLVVKTSKSLSTNSKSIKSSVSVSPSKSLSTSISPSISASSSFKSSVSVSPSKSLSTSISPSISKSISPSVSPSVSKSLSPSISPSPYNYNIKSPSLPKMFPGGGFGRGKGVSMKGFKQPKQYTPSFYSASLKIKGSTKRSRAMKQSDLDIRPI